MLWIRNVEVIRSGYPGYILKAKPQDFLKTGYHMQEKKKVKDDFKIFGLIGSRATGGWITIYWDWERI